jgi:hypothetical protein
MRKRKKSSSLSLKRNGGNANLISFRADPKLKSLLTVLKQGDESLGLLAKDLLGLLLALLEAGRREMEKREVSNHILASRADPARRKDLGFTEEDLLREEEVGAHLFQMRKDGRGSEIQPLRIELGFGVPEDEFVEVAEEIGAETYRLAGPLTVELGEE